jgi:signal transduction histidine kinase/DNA-binding response OmpR family regulator/ABC-type amino acid transport substrate-binding protein
MSLAGSDYSTGTALLRRPRYAFLRGTAIRDQIAASSAEHFEAVFVDGYAQAYRALVSGEADAFFDEGLADAPFAGYGDVVAGNYSPHIYSPVSLATQNQALAPVIAVVQKALRAGASRQIVRLYNEGREDYLSHELYEEFSKEERDFIQSRSAPGRAIRLAAEHDNYPISFYNDRENAWQGIAFNVLEEVEKLTGLTFSVTHSAPLAWTELLRMLESGEAEMVTELIRSPKREGHFLWSDNAYQTDHYALLSRFDHEDIGINEILHSRVGLIRATAYAEAFRAWFPHHPDTVEYETTEEAFNALDHGDVEFVMATRNLVLRMTNFRERPDFKANIVFEHNYASLYGFSPGGELLKSVVSKAMRHIRTQDITGRWTRRVFDYRGKMAREQRLWLGGVSGLMLCVLVLLFIVLQRRKKEEKRLETTVRERTKKLVRQDELLHVINGAAAVLLASDDGEFETSLRRGLKMMARSVDADRAYIWRNSGEADAYTQAFEWRDMNVRPRTDTGEIVEFSYLKSIPEWRKKLAGGQCVNGTLRSLSQTEQERLAPYGIQSLLVVPVFSRNQFWGFVSFDDCHGERDFSPDEESILRSGSLMLANALIRHETMQSLVSAREEAISSTRAKSNFLSNMSHEMRTPMNAIIGMAAIGKTVSGVEKKDYAFGRIESASSHLLGVINDILDMSKIEANKFELSFAEFDFEKMLQKVADVINFRVEEKQQKFSIRIDGNIPGMLVGDDQRLAQVITNLLSNAVKFTPERGSVRLDASLLKEEDGICTIRIEVADTGIGISPDQQARLFKSFQQADNSISRKFGGTGLGLAISKQIVDMMGGTIWITSQMGQGATFSFTIQAKRVQRDAARAPAGSPTAWSGLRALAVSEAPEIRRYFESSALHYGFHCDTADGGGNACGRLKQHASYDICFIDWELAGMNAPELAGRIREYCPGCFIAAIVAMSRWNAAESGASRAGVDAFLTKPLFPSSIADCLNACLGADKSRATADARPGDPPDLRGYCLLLVEDVEINQEIVISLLEPTSLAIECAQNGAQAVRMFSAQPDRYDMIFMDIQMPEMDGYEATRRIRSLAAARAKEVPIVAMTANVFREDIEKCLEAGMNDHIGKPLDLEEMFDKLRRYLPRRAAGDPGGSLSGGNMP